MHILKSLGYDLQKGDSPLTPIEKLNWLVSLPHGTKRCYPTINCYGAVKWLLTSETSEPLWMEASQMSQWLAKHTNSIPFEETKRGDLVVCQKRFCRLIHVAVLSSPNQVWHKPGSLPAEHISLDKMKYVSLLDRFFPSSE